MTKQRTALYHNVPRASRQHATRKDQKGRHLPHTVSRPNAKLHLRGGPNIRVLGVLRDDCPSHDSGMQSRGRKERQSNKRTRVEKEEKN